jgi:hypothetical protein
MHNGTPGAKMRAPVPLPQANIMPALDSLAARNQTVYNSWPGEPELTHFDLQSWTAGFIGTLRDACSTP